MDNLTAFSWEFNDLYEGGSDKFERDIVWQNHLLGEGTYGKVYKCYDKIDKTEVAVKKMTKSDLTEINDIKSELQVLEHLGNKPHKNILPCKRFYAELAIVANSPIFLVWVVMPLCRSSVQQELSENHFSEQQVLKMVDQISQALEHLQREDNTYHRDIKPNNILITFEGDFVIADFGVSKRVAQLKNQDGRFSYTQLKNGTTVVGTPNYFTPEMYKAFRKGTIPSEPFIYGKQDVFSLGISALEMCFGTRKIKDLNKGKTSIIKRKKLINKIKCQKLRKIISGMLKESPQERSSINESIIRVNGEDQFQDSEPQLANNTISDSSVSSSSMNSSFSITNDKIEQSEANSNQNSQQINSFQIEQTTQTLNDYQLRLDFNERKSNYQYNEQLEEGEKKVDQSNGYSEINREKQIYKKFTSSSNSEQKTITKDRQTKVYLASQSFLDQQERSSKYFEQDTERYKQSVASDQPHIERQEYPLPGIIILRSYSEITIKASNQKGLKDSIITVENHITITSQANVETKWYKQIGQNLNHFFNAFMVSLIEFITCCTAIRT